MASLRELVGARSHVGPATRPRALSVGATSPVAASRRWLASLLRTRYGGVIALVATGAALRLWLMLRGWPALDSDEAIIGLMARHILNNGERPIFYYGQHYLGALEAYVAAGAFALLGPTTLALHLSELPLVIGFLVAAYCLGRAAYGPTVGLLTLAFLAVGPAFGLLRETAVIGGYQETLLLGALLLLMVYARLRRPDSLPTRRREWARTLAYYAALGVVAGLGIWSNQLIYPFVVAAFVALAVGRRREMRHLPVLALLAGLVIGCWPFLVYNLQHGGATFAELAQQNRAPGHGGPLPALPTWLGQIGATLSVGLPALLGSPHVCIGRSSAWASYPPALAVRGAPLVGLCGSLNVVYALGVLCCYGVVAWQLGRVARAWWQGRARRQSGERDGQTAARRALAAKRAVAAEDAARLWLRAMLLFVAASIVALYTLSWTARVYQFTAARYLLPVYVTLPLVFGVLWEHAGLALKREMAWLVALGKRGNVASVAPQRGKSRLAGLDPAGNLRGRASGENSEHTLTSVSGSAKASLAAGADRKATRPRSGERATQDAAQERGMVLGPALGWALRWSRPARAGAAAGWLALLLGFAAYGAAATVWQAGDTAQFGLPAPSADQRLLAALSQRGITRFTADYWTCYRLAFESGERLRCAVRDSQNGTLTRNGAVNRYLPYLTLIERTPHPAYIFAAGSAGDATFDAWAEANGLPHTGYTRIVSEGYAIYYWPGGQG